MMVHDATAAKLVLIVEDDDVEREGLSAILRREGFCIREATTGDQALEGLREELPNLILLDMLLPDSSIDGWMLLDQIRSNPAWAFIPVIIVTGLAIASLEWSSALGALDIVKKPIDSHELLGKVRRYCR